MLIEGFINIFFKVSDWLNEIVWKFIEFVLFIVVVMKVFEGLIDVLFKGDFVGFVEVYDDKMFIILDRLGNYRVDGFYNLFEDLNIVVFFVVLGYGDMLCVVGKV